MAFQPQDRHFRNSYNNRLKNNRPIVPEGQRYPIQSTDNSLDIPTHRIATNWRVANSSSVQLFSCRDATITSKRKLLQDLENARARGWYESVEEAYEGIMALAISFHIADEIYSLSVVGPISRIRDSYEDFIQHLLQIKNQLQIDRL